MTRKALSRRATAGLVTIMLALLVAIAVSVLVWYWRADECEQYGCPTGRTREFAENMSIDGFARAFRYEEGPLVVTGYTGDAGQDVLGGIHVPGADVAPPNPMPVDERESAIAIAESAAGEWERCSVLALRVLPLGLHRYEQHIQQSTLERVRAGRSDLVVLLAECP